MDARLKQAFSRRQALTTASALAAGFAIGGREAIAQVTAANVTPQPATKPQPDRDGVSGYKPVIVPNGWTLPYRFVDGVKVFHLVAEEVDHEFAPGLRARCWGYNGSVHGPVIEAVEGDRVRIYVTNKLRRAEPASTGTASCVPNGMDGVGGPHPEADPGGPDIYVYEFTLRQHGTLMYHSHHDEMTQMGMGMTGLLIIHPQTPESSPPDRDFAILLHEWAIEVGADRPDPNEMTDFNVLTMNARVFPGTAPLIVKQGDRVRIRLGNLGAMDHHPIHLHGVRFIVTGTEGGPIPESARAPSSTVLVGVGETRDIEFVADSPGDWSFHCHMTHHVMTQMGHHLPNMIGVKTDGVDTSARPLLPGYMTMGTNGMDGMGDMGMKVPANSIPMAGGLGPHDYITMGGMFTIVKVRASLPNGYEVDPGWYENPPGELAERASEDVLRANGIAADASDAPRAANADPVIAPPADPTVPAIDDRQRPAARGAYATTTVTARTYSCPMHPEVVATEPGRCPKCGMQLVERS